MAASDGGRSEGSNDPASMGAPTGEAPLVNRTAAAARVSDPSAKLPVSGRSALPMTIVSGAMARAVKASTPSRATAVRFALGVPVGLVVSMVISALVTLFYPLTVPMSFFLTLSTTMATAILFARGFPLKDAFTNKERLQLERLRDLYDMRMEPIDRRAAQMREHGMTGPEIEAALGPEWQRVREEHDRSLAALDAAAGATLPVLPAEAPKDRQSSPEK